MNRNKIQGHTFVKTSETKIVNIRLVVWKFKHDKRLKQGGFRENLGNTVV